MGGGSSTVKSTLTDLKNHAKDIDAFASLYLRHTKSTSSDHILAREQKAAFKIQAMWQVKTKGMRKCRANSLLFQDFHTEVPTPLHKSMETVDEDDIEEEEQESSGEDAEYGDQESSDASSDSVIHVRKFAFEELLSAQDLIQAITEGRIRDLQAILASMVAQGIRMDWINRPLDVKTKQFALHFAVNNGSVEILNRFLEHSHIDVNVKQFMGRTPLICAARDGKMEVLDALLAHNDIFVNITDHNNKTVRDFIWRLKQIPPRFCELKLCNPMARRHSTMPRSTITARLLNGSTRCEISSAILNTSYVFFGVTKSQVAQTLQTQLCRYK